MQHVCVIGLGYIGLPTASILTSNGFVVTGVDIDQSVVDTVNSGEIHIEEPGLRTLVNAAIASGNLRAGTEPVPADIFFIAVPTPLTEDKRADIGYVKDAAERITPYLEPGNLVILESTSPPGTCCDVLKPILEKSGLVVGKDIGLAHCPERVLPGKILKELIANDRVIGGFDPDSAKRAAEVYSRFVEGRIFLTSATTAETVKVIENTFRDVNIALANETALICEKLGIDAAEVARLANRHPRVNMHAPGPGVGGHCISVDPWFLVELFPDATELIGTARRRNDSMPGHCVRTIMSLLQWVDAPKVAALGLAFKGNVDDIRESPALEVVDQLRAEGVEVAAHDPHVKTAPIDLFGLDECLDNADCVVLLTDHAEYKLVDPVHAARLVRNAFLFDTRNALDHGAWREAGFEVRVLGSGSS